MKIKNRIIEILQHEISYYYENNQEMPEHEQEHIKEMIEEGYNQGELNDFSTETETDIRGWWQIVKN